MATLNLVSSMGANILYATKGDAGMDIIDHTAPYDNTLYLADPASFAAGRGFVLTAGKFRAGLSAAADIPYLGLSGLDVNTLPDSLRTRGMPYALGGQFNAWSVFNRFRIASTGLDPAATFTVGVPVTISSSASAAGNKGLITTLGVATDTVIGYVAPAGKYTNAHGVSVVEIDLWYVRGTTIKAL